MVAHTTHSKQGGYPDPSVRAPPWTPRRGYLSLTGGYPLNEAVNRSDSRSANATVTHMRSTC
jgi:hypothetical protein